MTDSNQEPIQAEMSRGEWQKAQPLKTVTELEPMDMVSCRVEYAGLDINVDISVPKDTWQIGALMDRAHRACREAMSPLLHSDNVPEPHVEGEDDFVEGHS